MTLRPRKSKEIGIFVHYVFVTLGFGDITTKNKQNDTDSTNFSIKLNSSLGKPVKFTRYMKS